MPQTADETVGYLLFILYIYGSIKDKQDNSNLRIGPASDFSHSTFRGNIKIRWPLVLLIYFIVIVFIMAHFKQPKYSIVGCTAVKMLFHKHIKIYLKLWTNRENKSFINFQKIQVRRGLKIIFMCLIPVLSICQQKF